jgi:hypothetical protein
MNRLVDHLMHAALLSVVVFLVLRYLVGQSNSRSVNNSVLVGVVAMVYMVVVGHGLPQLLNFGF